MSVTQTHRFSHSEEFEQPTYFSAPDNEILRDWLDTDTIVNSITDLSPVKTLSDLASGHNTEEEEEFKGNYSSMPHSLRRVLSAMNPQADAEAYYLSPPCPQTQECPLIRDTARMYTKSAPAPVKSILTRHDSGISLATTTKTSRRKKWSAPSVKFVEAPTVYHSHHAYSPIPSPPHSPLATPSGQRKSKPSRCFDSSFTSSPIATPSPALDAALPTPSLTTPSPAPDAASQASSLAAPSPAPDAASPAPS
ncbi:hypothetical protein C8R48DRAFT_778916 [Suillus tomentosus]|nr:hypothetical protein C8R48DRAFT_778916 [Suillus tomentosus]